MVRAVAVTLLLMLPAAAWAKTGGAMSPDIIGAVVVAVVTALTGGGGLLAYRRQKQGVEGREDLTARARVAIARDADEAALRERLDAYRDEVAKMREDLAAQVATQTRGDAKREALAEQVAELRSDLKTMRSNAEQERLLTQLLDALTGVGSKLDTTMADIARRSGDHRASS